MANYFDQFDEEEKPPVAQQAGNYFDQFDQQPQQQQQAQPQANYFDQFDQPAAQQPPPEPQAEGALGTAARKAVQAAPGVLGALAAGTAAAGAGRVAGAAAGRVVGGALGSVLGPIGTGVGVLAGGVAGGYLADKFYQGGKELLGFDDAQQQAVNAAAHPVASAVGEVAPLALGLSPGRGLQLGARAISAGLGGAAEGASQLAQGEFDPTRLATNVAAGAALPNMRGWLGGIEARGAAAAGRRFGQPEPHGSPGPDAAAGTAKEQPPPRLTPDVEAQLPTDYYAKPPRVTETEAPPAAPGELAPRGTEGEAPPAAQAAPQPQVTPVDPAIDAAINKRPIEPRVAPVEEPPTQYGPALEREFPRVTEMPETVPPGIARGPEPRAAEGEAPAATARAPEPGIENLARTPREAMEQKAPDETYGQVLRRLASDERGGGRLPRGEPEPLPKLSPEDEDFVRRTQKLFQPQKIDHMGKVNDISPETMDRTTAVIRQLTGDETTTPIASRSLRSVLSEHDPEHLPEWARGFTKEYIARLDKITGDTPVHFISDGDFSKYAAKRPDGVTPLGIYEPNHDFIMMHDSASGMEHVLHEATHAATYHQLENDPRFKPALRAMMDVVRRQANKNAYTRYGMTNEHEFLSEALSNNDFQRLLRDTPVPASMAARMGGKGRIASLWDGFIESIRRTLGFEPNIKARDMLEYVLKVAPGDTSKVYKSTAAAMDAEPLAMAGPRRPTREEPGAGPVAKATDEAMPTPGVIEGDVIPGAKAKVDASLQARGFTPEQIAKMKPKAKEAILQKREGEVGAGPPPTARQRAEAIVRGPAPGEAPATEALPPSGLPTIQEINRMSKKQLTDLASDIGVGERQLATAKTKDALARHVLDRVDAINKNRAAVEAAPAAEVLNYGLANQLLNRPAMLKTEAAKRGMTPEALKAQAKTVLDQTRTAGDEISKVSKTLAGPAPEAPLPGRPAEMSPVGGEKIAPAAGETEAAAIRRTQAEARTAEATERQAAQAKQRATDRELLRGQAGKPPNKPPTVGQAAAAAGGTPPPPPSGPASMVYAPRQKRSDLGDLVRSVKLLVGGDIGPIGRLATESIRKSYGNLNRVYEQGHALLERHREQVFNTSEADRWKINDKIENGTTTRNWQPSPEQQTLINDIKSVMDHWKEQLQGLGRTAQMEFVQNYLPHMYENPDAARDFFNSWGKRGGAGSTKKRTLPTYQDAIDAGLKPLTSDPIELAQRYGLSMKHFIASNEVLERAVNTGVAGYFKAGKSIGASGSPSPLQVGGPPPGWKRLNAPPNKQGHELYAPEDYADKYNAFYNKGFFGGAHAPIYNAARNANSAWTSLELGLNPYHFFTMVNEAMITDIAKGFDQMFSGQFTKGMRSIRNSPIAGRTRYVEGRRFQQEYLNPNSTDPIASVVSEANARPIGKGHALDVLGSPNDPRTPVRGSFLKNFSSENINFEVRKAAEEFKQDFEKAGTSYERVKFAGRQMSRMLQTVGAPIFDKYIPALKAGALHSHMEAWFGANAHIDPHNMTPEQRQLAVKAAIKYTDTIDNRFGEMIHDNTFMNKTMQQAATVLMRSFSWTVGAMREIAGGSVAGAKAFSALGRGENKFSMRHPEYDPRISYVAALGAGVSITSAIYQYLHTGELPQDINDLYAPRTGGTVPGLGGKGEVPEHVLMPGFHKDVYGWLTHPLSEAYAKSSGLSSTAYEQLTNEDWRGDPIYRRGADPVEHMTQRASHLFGRFGPISIKNMIKGQPDTSGISSTETALGFRAPGAAIQDPKQLENWMRVKSEREWEAKQRHERTAAKKYESREVQKFHKGGPVLPDKKKDEFVSKRARTNEWFDERDREADKAGYGYPTTPEDRPYSIMPPRAPVTPAWSDMESEGG